MTPRLKDLYFKEIQSGLKEKFGFKNTFMSPQLQKVVVNMGLGLDGADVAVLVGPDVIDFKLGNEVFYASQFTSHGGSHADYKLVGETIGWHNPQA